MGCCGSRDKDEKAPLVSSTPVASTYVVKPSTTGSNIAGTQQSGPLGGEAVTTTDSKGQTPAHQPASTASYQSFGEYSFSQMPTPPRRDTIISSKPPATSPISGQQALNSDIVTLQPPSTPNVHGVAEQQKAEEVIAKCIV